MKIFLLSVLLFISVSVHSQYKIHGLVENFQGQPLGGATVTLTIGDNFQFYFTDKYGHFSFKDLKPDIYLLEVHMLGYERRSQTVELTDKDLTINLILALKPVKLDEFVIIARSPIVVKEDTIVFDAASFYTGREEVVGELLANLPGIAVNESGQVKFMGEPIKYVLIEGTNMFDQGYSLITQNMPVQPIDRVELLTNFSENQVLKGLTEESSHAINLRLKPDFKNTIFGEAELSAGHRSDLGLPHDLSGNVMYVSRQNKLYTVITQNNLGFTHAGSVETLGEKVVLEREPEVGDNHEFTSPVSIIGPGMGARRQNLNNERVVGISNVFLPFEELSIRFTGGFNSDNRRLFRQQTQQFSHDLLQFQNIEINNFSNKPETVFGRINIDYEPSTRFSINASSMYRQEGVDGHSKQTFNAIEQVDILSDNRGKFDHLLRASYRINERQGLKFVARYIANDYSGIYRTNAAGFESFFEVPLIDTLSQHTNSTNRFFGTELLYSINASDAIGFNIRLGFENSLDRLNNIITINEEENTIQNASGSNRLFTGFLNARARLELGTLKISPSIGFYDRTIIHSNNRKRNQINFSPEIFTRWEISRLSRLELLYAKNTFLSPQSTYYPFLIFRGRRSMYSGIGGFHTLSNTLSSAHFRHGDFTTRFLLSLKALYINGIEILGLDQVISPYYTLTRNNIDINRQFFLTGSANYLIRAISLNAEITGNYSRGTSGAIINQTPARIESEMVSGGLELRSVFDGWFNFHLGLNFGRVNYGAIGNISRNINSFLDLEFDLLDNLKLVSKFDFFQYSLNYQTVQSHRFFDIEARYRINRNFRIMLRANNILDSRYTFSYHVANHFTNETKVRLLPRLFLLQVEYRFR